MLKKILANKKVLILLAVITFLLVGIAIIILGLQTYKAIGMSNNNIETKENGKEDDKEETYMKFDPIFRSHMVFAVGKPIRIYGEGNGSMEINFASCTKQVEAVDGNWFVEFPPMEYGGPYQIIAESENESVTIEDIYIGDVYLFAGQSNMQFKLNESSAPANAYKSNEKLRLFSTDRLEAGEYFTPADGWVKSERDTVGPIIRILLF